MEMLSKKIKEFLTISGSVDGYGDGDGSGSGSGDGDGFGDGDGDGYGYGSGDGDGSGSGSGSGYGSGSGSGYGYGDGDGFGDGDGDGYGSGDGYGYGYSYGLNALEGNTIYIIDSTQTIIDSVHGNFAKGRIVNNDFSTSECYIAKVYGRFFAHGKTLKDAFRDAMAKSFIDMPEDERIAKFNEQYPERNVKIPAMELFDWHNRLTGSCEMGRRNFASNHGIDLNHDRFTVVEFVNLTKNDYGGEIISRILK